MGLRYVVVEPVPHGDRFWEITDTAEDFAAATIWAELPNAEQETRDLCARLNAANCN